MEYGPGPGWIIGSSDGGNDWRLLVTTPQTWYASIACPTTTTCLTVGGAGGAGQTNDPVVLVTTDAGEHWSHQAVPPQVGALFGIACPSSDTCLAVPGIARTTNGGVTWSVENTPTGFGSGSLDSVTCPTSSFCVLGGSGPGAGPTPALASVSHDAGASWSTAVSVGGSTGLGPISCTDTQHCVGLVEGDATNSYGTALPTVTADGGTTWREGSPTIGQAVSCVAAFCVSVGGLWTGTVANASDTNTYPADVFVSTDSGADWVKMQISDPYSLTAVTCLSTVDCIAVGGDFPNPGPGVIMNYGE